MSEKNPAILALESKLADGWDINERKNDVHGRAKPPALWGVVGDAEQVRWFLAHGASVHLGSPDGQDPAEMVAGRPFNPTALERAASDGTVEAFELLRAAGAPLGWRPLHLAVQMACIRASIEADRARRQVTDGATPAGKTGTADPNSYDERFRMVRHLVDKVGVDADASDTPDGRPRAGFMGGNALCYVELGDDSTPRDLIRYLLDRGADPTKALSLNGGVGWDTRFAPCVEEWRAERASQQGGQGKCAVQ